MTNEEAWTIINQATAKLPGTRQDHQLIVEALNVLKPKEDVEDEK